MTFPPQEVNGFIMPGFLTPKKSPRRSYPRELAGKIESSIPGYNNYVDEYMGGSEKNWVNYLKQTAHNRGKASRYLVKEHLTQLSPETENSLFLVHFFATDLVQHFLWDRASDEWDPRLEVFRAVDEEVGKLMEIAPERSSFLVASDHGFGPVERIFNVNNWLRKEGYLKLSGSPRTEFKKILSRSGLNQHRLKPLGEKIYPIVKGLGLAPGNIISASSHPLLKTCFLSERDVDWKDTVAYSKSDVGHIRLNLIGREREGAVTERQGREVIEEIKLKLEDLKVPSADTGLVEWVKPKEDLYWGPYLKDAPDLLFNSLDRKSLGFGAAMFLSEEIFVTPFKPGNHRRNGIIMASGPTIQSGKKDARIVDIAPTLLNLFNYRVPEQMDGKVINEIAPGEPDYYRPKDFYRSREINDELEESRKKLENLGYL